MVEGSFEKDFEKEYDLIFEGKCIHVWQLFFNNQFQYRECIHCHKREYRKEVMR